MLTLRRSVFACALASIAGVASAVGPDVIVGDMPDTQFYTATGAINGFHAYAVGTVSCNLGDAPLQWISSTNRHPVISQNMYRLYNGRFEHLGQSFLKHGFTALQGTICSPCTAYPNGTHLGVGCSDPYSASLNGSQSGLGPKSEINAATGFYPYPYTNMPGSGTLNRRLQVRQADLATPGALYFVASQYIAPDDIEAGNDNNNQSYRRVTINANYSLTLQNTTQRGRPAIEAWRDHGGGVGIPDPNVTLSPVDIPSDGRMIVGSRAYDTGTGTYRYEFAVQNLNSDRSGGSFSVPIPAGAVVTNVGFRDVDYHSGEPYSLSDWASSVSSTSVTWSTEAFATNANANALRWDTIYSFWFETNSAPAPGSVTVGLFKPGATSEIQAAASIPGGGAPPPPTPPANDACANAIAILSGPTSFTTLNATTDGPAETLCDLNGSNLVANDVWFRYTAPCAGTASITTCGASFDTRLAVYAGSACPSAADTGLACNDDAASCGAGSLQSALSFTVVANAEYLIRVGGFNGATGTGSLTLTGPTCAPSGPANDLCVNAIPLSNGVGLAGTSIGASNDGTASCGGSATSADVWYAYTPASTATVTVSTCNAASFDTVLSIHSACGGTQVACLDDTTGCSGYTTTLTATMNAGTTYLIRVAGYNGATGTFTITASGGGTPPPGPFNDLCANRIGIPLGTIAFDTTGATTDGIAHATCASNGQTQITNDIWYNYPCTTAGTLTVSTCGSGFDTWIAVYDDYGCANYDTRLMACSDDASCSGTAGNFSVVAVPVQAGRSYTIRVGGFNGATGAGQLALSVQTAAAEHLLVSFETTTAVPGLGNVENEDIVEYNPLTGIWTMIVDGSDVGLAGFAIDGMARTQAGEFLLSFTTAGTITGMTGGPSGSTTLDDSDIVRFIPTSTGDTTAGSFVFYFDGSDVGLTQNAEDIDAIALHADGRLILSFVDATSTTGTSGATSYADEDLAIFTATSLGATTAGAFAMHFDGSDVGLTQNSEDLAAAAVHPGGSLLLSTLGAYAVTGLSGDDDDVIRFTPGVLGSTTSGTYARYIALTNVSIPAISAIAAIDLRVSNFLKGGPAAPSCNADLNCDGQADADDIECLSLAIGGLIECACLGDPDFNMDGALNGYDIEAIANVIAGGACP